MMMRLYDPNHATSHFYIENLETGKILKNNLPFRVLCEFKIRRARGDFKDMRI